MTMSVVSQLRLFWQEIGKLQVIAIFIILAAYFFILSFAGNKDHAAISIDLIVIIAIMVTSRITSAIAIIAFSASAIATLFTSDSTLAMSISTSIAIVVIAIFVIGIATDQAVEYGIKKGVVWLSFITEFFAILLPILLVH